ncbi:MAG TPA: hypothetical protein VH520_00890, partial [Streptosporangiaceae bacterium]
MVPVVIFFAILAVLGIIAVGGAVKSWRTPEPDQASFRTAAGDRALPRPGQERAGGRGGRRRRDPDLLPAEATVSFDEERQDADIDSVLRALDHDLVGLVPVKRKVDQIASLLLVDRARNKFGLIAPRPNLHMCFTGPPGTGKTTMAFRMAELLQRLGYLEKGQLVHAMRD